MKRKPASRKAYVVLVAVIAALVPAAAYASITPGGGSGFNNTYAQVGGTPSDPQSNVCSCHIPEILQFYRTKHAADITNANGDASQIDPTMTAYWPSPAFNGGFRMNPQDIGWVMGAYSGSNNPPPAGEPGDAHDYVLGSGLWGGYGTQVTLSTGSTFTAFGPADDVGVALGVGFSHATTSAQFPQGMWTNSGKVFAIPFFQSCGGCHALGVTRPSKAAGTLGNGAAISPATPTSWAATSINCENCHGTGKTTSQHWWTLPGVVGAVGGNTPKKILSSGVCGQCHVAGYSSEKGTGGSAFSGPNGYTTDMTLAAWNITSAAQGAYSSFTVYRLSMETTTNGLATTNFYPDGHNKGMMSGYYNEWLESGHAKSLSTILDMGFLPSFVKATCLPCHSAEGYLAGKGYRAGPFQLAMTSSPSTDKYNVECVVCHTPHDPTTGLGLRASKDEMCQQCHTDGIPEGGQATPGQEINDPPTPLRGGYGLIDVPAPADWMPGAACPDCHMPATNGSAPSHRFKPMLPGDAAAWNVPVLGDSCTPCHRSRTRAQLQAKIDDWKSTVDDEAAKASAAIDAAKTRPASATAVGISLINRASTNLAFANDPGAAIHNFPYMVAGMKKTAAMAKAVGGSIAIEGLPASVVRGGRAHISGAAHFGDGTAAAGETMVFERRTSADPTWRAFATVTCDADGEFAVAPVQTAPTEYRAYWKASSVDQIWASGTVSVGITTATSISAPTSLLLSTTLTRRGFAIRGTVTPSHTGSQVRIYGKKPGSTSYAVLATRTLGASGYSLTYKPARRGAYYFYTRFLGDATGSASLSRTTKVLVR
jgi:predicted CXXCH cytochrome family protein